MLAAFLTEGHFARHLRRMRLRYAERSEALALALIDQFGDDVRLRRPDGGLSLLARFPGRGPDAELVGRARAAGLAPSALSAHAVRHQAGDALQLGFTNIAPEQAAEAALRLRQALAAA